MWSTVLGFLEVINHSSISATEATGFARPWVGVTMNLKRFDALLDKQLSIIRLYFFFFFVFFLFLLRSKDDQNE